MNSPKDRIGRVLASVPLNATAARVMTKGEHYEPDIKYGTHWHSSVPPPLKNAAKLKRAAGRELARQLIGKKFGRLTVIGLSALDKGSGSAKWAVRCVCGDYEIRTAKSIRNPTNSEDRCQNCWHLAKANERYARLGARSIEEFKPQESQVSSGESPTTDDPTTTQLTELQAVLDAEVRENRLTKSPDGYGLPEWIFRGVIKDIVGQRFGLLTVLNLTGIRPHNTRRLRTWLCRCDCGAELLVDGARLRSGNTKSCGCLRRESARTRSRYRGARGLFAPLTEDVYV